MKNVLTIAGWAVLSCTILWVALRPEGGLFFGNTSVTLALGMIGVGLCHHARQRRLATATQTQDR
ncbi:MAG: hypothetical protein K8S99_14085 [Planctomycetes bacterium]|nr:hypothetical protein [Planctomycetota bacterium]